MLTNRNREDSQMPIATAKVRNVLSRPSDSLLPTLKTYPDLSKIRPPLHTLILKLLVTKNGNDSCLGFTNTT